MTVFHTRQLRVCHFTLPVFIFCLLTVSGAIALWRGEQDELRKLENRVENSFPTWSFVQWKDGKLQGQFDEALSDRLPCAVKSKQLHFHWRNPLLLTIQKLFYSFSDYYVNFKDNVNLYGDLTELYLIYDIYSLGDDSQNSISIWAEGIQSTIDNNQDVPFYLYYVTRDDDLRLDNGYRMNNFQTITSVLPIPKSHTASLQINDFEHYRQYFYQTDHHWQCFGSFQGYKDVFYLLGLDRQGETLKNPIEPTNDILGMPDGNPPVVLDGARPVLVSRKHHEAKSRDTGTAELFKGKIYMYCFDYAPMHIYKNGESVQIGNEELVLHNQDTTFENGITYSKIYGLDYGELVFETQRKDRPNILIIGDSYDNAILKLLAGHFHHLYSVDLRHYSKQMEEPINLCKYINEHDINQVLIIGSWIMFNSNLYEPLHDSNN